MQIKRDRMPEASVSEHAQEPKALGKKEFSSASNSISNYERIIDLLKKNSSGLTTAELSKCLKISRNTTAISLARLEGAGQIEIRKVGKAKLYSLKPEIQTKLLSGMGQK